MWGKKFLALFFVIFIIPACETIKKKPDWLEGSSSQYPSTEYLLGIGRASNSGNPADDQVQAEQNARSEIARQIQTRIQSYLTTEAEEEIQRLGPEEQRRFSQRIRTEVSASANIELEGMEIAERFYDEKSYVYYALAIIDRKRTGEILLARLNELNREIDGLMTLVDEHLAEKQTLQALSYLIRAEALLKQAIGIRSQYMVISGSAPVNKYHLSDLISKEEQIRNSTRIMVMVFEKAPGMKSTNVIASGVQSALAGLGFFTLSAPYELRAKGFEVIKEWVISGKFGSSAQPNYLVLGNFEVKKISQTRIGKHIYYFYKTGGELLLLDVLHGNTLLSMIDSSPEATKAGKPNQEQAIEASLEQAGRYFSELWIEVLKQRYLTP